MRRFRPPHLLRVAPLREQLAEIEKGIIRPHGDIRDYTHFADFIRCIERSTGVNDKERKGFFNLFVDKYKGLKVFDQKEVDTNIVIRAMDAFNDYEADSLCIISSDQDFVPLHKRAEKSGVETYQADVAKFADQKYVGRRIRELGNKFIPTGLAKEGGSKDRHPA